MDENTNLKNENNLRAHAANLAALVEYVLRRITVAARTLNAVMPRNPVYMLFCHLSAQRFMQHVAGFVIEQLLKLLRRQERCKKEKRRNK